MASPTQPNNQPVVLNPSREPLPLTALQETQVREIYHKNVRQKCAAEIRDFAACCTSRTITVTIMCRQQRNIMNSCMMQYATQAGKDAAREEWFETIDKRRQEREEQEKERAEAEKFWKQWWDKENKAVPFVEGSDDKGRRQ